jgi:hypothetical protein
MPHSFLIFDFGTNEETAQQARHRLEGWKQAFRLDKKLQLKFERKETEQVGVEGATSAAPAKAAKSAKTAAKGQGKQSGKSKAASQASSGSGSKDGSEAAESSAEIRLIVRLDFSDHEKLTYQRWIERIPSEEPFKGANPKLVRTGEADFRATSDLFDSLD